MTDMSNDPFADSELYDGDDAEVFDGVPDLVDRSRDGAQDDAVIEDEIGDDQ